LLGAFPTGVDIQTIFSLWYFGNDSMNLGPYRLLSPKQHFPLKKDQVLFSKAKKVMEYMDKIIDAHRSGVVLQITFLEEVELFMFLVVNIILVLLMHTA
jgi:hypothetical protein